MGVCKVRCRLASIVDLLYDTRIESATMSITVTLDPAVEARLRARVDAGEFSSVDEAVEEALREFVLLEPPIDELRTKIDAAIAELDRGEGVPLDIEDLKRSGRERLRNRSK